MLACKHNSFTLLKVLFIAWLTLRNGLAMGWEMNNFKRLKIMVNGRQPAHSIARELERQGYKKDRFQAQNPDFVMTYTDGFYVTYSNSNRFVGEFSVVTLEELKGLNK